MNPGKPVTRYPPQNISNPFAQLHPQPNPHQQASHLQHPAQSLQNHQFTNAHHAFTTAGNQPSIFGPHGSNGVSGPGSSLRSSFAGGGGLGGAGSQAAQMSFNHGPAGMPHLQQSLDARGNLGGGQAHRIREVWKHNLAEEMATIRLLIDKYPYISMDTEFPGVVARPIAEDFGSKSAYHYQTMRCNVDILKIIQLGITLFNADGEVVPADALQHLSKAGGFGNTICPCTWNFNFQFDLQNDMYNEVSIQLLKTAGVDFEKHTTLGIDVQDFGSLLVTSGLTFSDDVWWVSFHGGYDFGYLLKVIWNRGLPQDEDHYRVLVKKMFPNIYDVKFILNHARKMRDRGTITATSQKALETFGIKNGLQEISDDLGLQRVGVGHTGGSDAWLTGMLFFEVRKRLFDDDVPAEFNGQMWGLTGIGPPASAAAQAAVLASQAAVANGMAPNPAYHQSGHHREGGPSTPTTNPAGLASTPSQGFSTMTPGAGGAFGNFQGRRQPNSSGGRGP